MGTKHIGTYVVVYDISSDAERTKIDKLLCGFGVRAQKSVFECTLDKKGKNELISGLKKSGIKTGFIKIYRLEFSLNNGDIIGTPSKTDKFDQKTAYVI